jgi:hypothetical protein
MAGLIAAPLALACDYPEKNVSIPDGANATQEEMVAAQQAVRTYIEALTEYQECLDAEKVRLVQAAAEEEEKQKLTAMYNSRHNAAVDDMEQVAAAFNEQVKRYKDAN